ncbi:glyoxylate/hydroxypyruvate reductase B isoform X2 [Gadus macrocephalus]|uniref:glyoxylate/hydroxypyruvate reductase B isoform X2 n=2 Tax=Gadus macrocephalus TaxID=80720 RepID=UPI0028CB6BFD|nr:glyoxylate/hydroxypyruvate reductase B isoform X2 [Gadus macrocephalus]
MQGIVVVSGLTCIRLIQRLKNPGHIATRLYSTTMEKPYVLTRKFGRPEAIYSSLSSLVEDHFTVIDFEKMASQPEVKQKIQAILVWGCSTYINSSFLQGLPNLKVVVNGGVGVDHLDIPLINSFGVKVTNTPDVVCKPTADLAMGLMLASARNIIQGDSFSRDHEEGEDIGEIHLGKDISNKTLGIVGMGNIGKMVAKRAQGFDMKIYYHNRTRRPVEEEQKVGAEYCPVLNDLLAMSDYVVVLVNLTAASTHLIGREQLSAMKSSATLINISRGKVVDQEALVEALQNKVIQAAALDVTYPEPLPRGHPLLSLPNVIVLPHMGTHTLETTCLMIKQMVANALAALAGDTPPNEVIV